MRLFLMVSFLLIFSTSFAADALVEYRVIGTRTLVSYSFEFEQTDLNLSFSLPADARAVELFLDGTESDIIIVNESRYKKVQFQTGKSLSMKLLFITDEYVGQGETHEFLSSLKTPINISDLTVRLWLPERAFLDELSGGVNAVNPTPKSINTDGRSLTIEWKERLAKGESFTAFVRFITSSHSFPLIWLVAPGFVVTIALIIYYFLKNDKKISVQKKTTPNNKRFQFLLPGEALVVEELRKMPDKALKQKELVWRTGLSKVKISRIVKRLENRNVVNKLSRGNSNIIQLIE